MPKRRDYVRSFEARDEYGVRYTLNIYVDIIDVGTTADPNAETGGQQSIETDDGLHVKRLEKGKYQVAARGVSSIGTGNRNKPPAGYWRGRV